MTITGALVLFAVIWFLALFVALPIGERSQSEAGDVVPGTPASAPEETFLKKKIIWVTIATTILWVILCGVIVSGMLSVEMFDVFNRMGPPAE